jgi:23S rRNA G2069 N7-methylase RlmK/C1962 C5-methylase RlmI
MKTIKKTIKKEIKKEVWGDKLDKNIADFKKKSLKNKNVSLYIVTTDDKNNTNAMIVNHYGDLRIFVISFLKSMDKQCPEALRVGILKWISDR